MTNRQVFPHSINEVTMLVGSGAMGHSRDDEQVARLEDRIVNSTQLDVSKAIATAGKTKLPGTLTGTIYGTFNDQTKKQPSNEHSYPT